MQNPLNQHYQLLKHILHHIKGTLTYGLPLNKIDFTLTAYVDLDWTSAPPIDKKSIVGFCIYLGSNLLS